MFTILCYIDPNTMHNVFSFLGPLLAMFTAGAGVVVSAFLFFRRRVGAWFKRVSRLKLFILSTAVVLAGAAVGLFFFIYLKITGI